MIIQPELANQVGSENRITVPHRITKVITAIILVGLVLFVIPFSTHIEKARIENPAAPQLLIEEKLVMRLGIVIRFVFIGCIGLFGTGIVRRPVIFQVGLRNAVPGLVGFFLARKNIQPKRTASFLKRLGNIVRPKTGAGPVDISAAADA